MAAAAWRQPRRRRPDPLAGETPDPPLLPVICHGVYLPPNGLSQLHAAPGQPHASGDYAEGYGTGTPHVARNAATGLPGGHLIGIVVPAAVLHRLRGRATGHDVCTPDLTASRVLLGVARRTTAAHRGA